MSPNLTPAQVRALRLARAALTEHDTAAGAGQDIPAAYWEGRFAEVLRQVAEAFAEDGQS